MGLFFNHAVLIFLVLGVSSPGLYFWYDMVYYPVPRDIEIVVKDEHNLPVSKNSKEVMYRGLKLIKGYSPQDYEFVNEYVEVIEVKTFELSVTHDFYAHAAAYYDSERGDTRTITFVRIPRCPDYCSEEGWTGLDLRAAQIIIHEACHSWQFSLSRPYIEQECYDMANEFADKVGPNLWHDFQMSYFFEDGK